MKSICLFLSFWTCFFSLFAENKRPNILFAFADDWGKHASIYAGLEGEAEYQNLISTPHIDKVAKRGVLFKNAFVSSPSCTPCRSSLLSGKHFWETGKAAILQGAVWDGSNPAYPLVLQDSGYFLGETYKVWSPGAPRDAPYGAPKNSFEKYGSKFNQFSQNVYKSMDAGDSMDKAKSRLLDEARMNFKTFLKARKENGNAPFCYWFGPTNVHRKWIKGSGKKMWGIDPDSLKGKMPPFLPDVHAIREDLADYFGEVQAFDMGLGVLIEELEKAGELDNTIIAISGDHGAPGFPQGKCNLYDFGSNVPLMIAGPGIVGNRVVDDFVSLPDLAPTFIEAGKAKIPSAMSAKSLWPTLKSKATGLVDKSRTQVYIGRERHVAVARPGYLPYPQRAIRTKDYLFITNFKPERYPMGDPYLLGTGEEPSVGKLEQSTFVTLGDEDAGPTKAWLVTNRDSQVAAYKNAYGKRPLEELYDLSKDPHQMNNLAGSIEYKEVRESLKKRLFDELQKTNDPRLVDDGSFFETEPMISSHLKQAKKKKKK